MHQTVDSSPQSHLLKLYQCITSPKHPADRGGQTPSNLSSQASAYLYLDYFLPSDRYEYSVLFILWCLGLCPLEFLCLMYF